MSCYGPSLGNFLERNFLKFFFEDSRKYFLIQFELFNSVKLENSKLNLGKFKEELI